MLFYYFNIFLTFAELLVLYSLWKCQCIKWVYYKNYACQCEKLIPLVDRQRIIKSFFRGLRSDLGCHRRVQREIYRLGIRGNTILVRYHPFSSKPIRSTGAHIKRLHGIPYWVSAMYQIISSCPFGTVFFEIRKFSYGTIILIGMGPSHCCCNNYFNTNNSIVQIYHNHSIKHRYFSRKSQLATLWINKSKLIFHPCITCYIPPQIMIDLLTNDTEIPLADISIHTYSTDTIAHNFSARFFFHARYLSELCHTYGLSRGRKTCDTNPNKESHISRYKKGIFQITRCKLISSPLRAWNRYACTHARSTGLRG